MFTPDPDAVASLLQNLILAARGPGLVDDETSDACLDLDDFEEFRFAGVAGAGLVLRVDGRVFHVTVTEVEERT